MNLQLSLKTQWFEMTKAGIKTEDYREITPYWIKRFVLDFEVASCTEFFTDYKWDYDKISEAIKDKCHGISLIFKNFTHNTMTLGYPKSGDNERIIKFEHAGIEIRTGNPEWGAEPNKLYFVIKHGKKL